MRRILALMALVAVVAVGCRNDHRDLAPPRPDGLIAYVAGFGSKSRINVRDLPSGALRMATRPSRGALEVLGWSLDGQRLRYAEHLGTGGLDVFVVDVKTSSEHRIRHYDVDGIPGPSARLVAVGSAACKYRAGEPLRLPLRIRLFAPSHRLRSDFRAIDRRMSVSTADVVDWAPNESKLAYEITSYDFSESCYFNLPATSLYESRVDGSRRVQVASDLDYSREAEYAPNSRYLAFVARCSPEADVCEELVVWNGGKKADVTPLHYAVSNNFEWYYPSEELVFFTTRVHPGQVMPQTYGEPRRVYRLVAENITTKHVRELAELRRANAKDSLTVTFIQPVQAHLVFFQLDSQLFAASVDGGRPLWRAPWKLGSNVWTPDRAAIFLR